MRKVTVFGWCMVALLAGIGSLIWAGLTVGSVVLFVGLPLSLMGAVWRFYSEQGGNE